MKRLIYTILAAVISIAAFGQSPSQELKWTEASDLGLVSKMMPTSNPYWRVDTARYHGFTKVENNQVRCGAGMSVAFKTDAREIWIRVRCRSPYSSISNMRMNSSGFDLYIKDAKGRWIYAGNKGVETAEDPDRQLVANMDGSTHECLLYFPIHTELLSCKIGVPISSNMEAMANPFHHRVVAFGSSYTHGSVATRPAMSYPKQLERRTGIQIISLGCGGNGRLQPYFADVLKDVEADAFLFDQFSNPSADVIRERLFPFIEEVQSAHPGIPLIFQQTIRRETRNFRQAAESKEAAKMAVADSLMKIAVKKYPDVYYIKPSASHESHEFFGDGVHPDSYGYWIWEQSIEKPLKRILRRYGIR